MSSRRLGLVLFASLLLLWLVGLAMPYDVVADVHPDLADAPPAAAHLLGTDHLGRDVLARLIRASRAFVLPGAGAAVVAGVLGLALGTVAGWFGGVAEQAGRLVFTVVGAVPRLVLVLLAATIVGDDPAVLAVAAGLVCAPELGSAVAARLGDLRRAEFVLALRAHGVSDARILGYHLLWVNARGVVARQLFTVFGYYVGLETTLSYLGGFGVQEPEPSWGNMVAFEFGRPDGNLLAWLAPALALWAAVVACSWLAEDLGRREAADG